MRDDTLPPWLAASAAFIKAAKETQQYLPVSTYPMTPAEYLAEQSADPRDPRFGLRREHRTNMVGKLSSQCPHGGPVQWDAALREAARNESWKWHEPPFAEEDRKQQLENMTGEQRHHESNKYGGKQ